MAFQLTPRTLEELARNAQVLQDLGVSLAPMTGNQLAEWVTLTVDQIQDSVHLNRSDISELEAIETLTTMILRADIMVDLAFPGASEYTDDDKCVILEEQHILNRTVEVIASVNQSLYPIVWAGLRNE